MLMLCWSQVEDCARWRAVFDSHAELHRRAGLTLKGLWRDLDDANRLHFLFEVADVDAARAFCEAPESAQAGVEAGAIDGGYRFLVPVSAP